MANAPSEQTNIGDAIARHFKERAPATTGAESSQDEIPADALPSSEHADTQSARSPSRGVSPLSDAEAIEALARLGTPTLVRWKSRDENQPPRTQVPDDVEMGEASVRNAGIPRYTPPPAGLLSGRSALSRDERSRSLSDFEAAQALARLGTPCPGPRSNGRESASSQDHAAGHTICNTQGQDAGALSHPQMTAAPTYAYETSSQYRQSHSSSDQDAVNALARLGTPVFNRVQLLSRDAVDWNTSHGSVFGVQMAMRGPPQDNTNVIYSSNPGEHRGSSSVD